MSKTITIRTDETLRKALEKRSLDSKTKYLRGRLTLKRGNEESWRKSLRERNWRS